MPDEVGNLFKDDDHADCGQQPFDDTGREEFSDEPSFGKAETDLDHPGKDHGDQEGRERTKREDLCSHNGRQSGSRAAHTGVRSAEQSHHNPADDSGHQSGH